MYAPNHDFFLALRHATKAARRGDIAMAERWVRLAERHTIIAERLRKLARPSEPQSPAKPPWARGH